MKSRLFRSLTLAILLGASFGVVSLTATPNADARNKFEKGSVDPAEDNFKQGMMLVRDRNYEAAIDSFLQAVYFSRNHYNPNAYKMLGLCYKATRQYPKAITALLEHLKQVQEPAADARIDLAECYIEVKEFDKARDAIRDSFRDVPSGKDSHRQRYAQGEVAERLKDYGQAVGFYDSAISEKPNYTDALMARARVETKLEDYVAALRDYRDILARNISLSGINYEELYYGMGTCLYKRGDHQGALDHWRLCLEQNPENYDAHLALASMLDEEKHISSAIKEYQAALRCYPKNGDLIARQKIEKRLLWLENQLAPKDAPAAIKPTPSMRRGDFSDETERRRPTMDQAPMPKDSGF